MEKNKSIVVTGCTSGFGLTLLKSLLAEGNTVFAICRNIAQRPSLFQDEKAKYPNTLNLISADLSNEDDINTATSEINGQAERIDALVNNAGYGLFGALEDLSSEQLREQFFVNSIAPALLTQKLLPKLRAAKGKVINVSSIMGQMAYPLSGAYSGSKFALEGWSEALYYELQPFGVSVCIVEPGGYRTKFASNVKWGNSSDDTGSPYFTHTQAFKGLMNKLSTREKAPNPDDVAELIQKLIHTSNPPLRVRSGKDAKSAYFMKRALPSRFFQKATSNFFEKLRKNSELR